MRLEAVRLRRFKGFLDSDWIQLRPITLLFGLNSSGKSSIISALRMVKQTLGDRSTAPIFLLATSRGVDLGSFEEVAHRHEVDFAKPIGIGLRLSLDSQDRTKLATHGIPQASTTKSVDLTIEVAYNKQRRLVSVAAFSIHLNDTLLIEGRRSSTSEQARFTLSSDIFSALTSDDSSVGFVNFVPFFEPRWNEHPWHSALSRLGEHIWHSLITEFDSLAYLGPLRTEAQRIYQFPGDSPETVGSHGEDALKTLFINRYSKTGRSTQASLNVWLSDLVGYTSSWSNFKYGLTQFLLSDTIAGCEVNFKDVGTGVSQILPVIIQGLVGHRRGILVLEQPELHLHPRAQATLADFLIALTARGARVIVESHSEHLLLRLRRRIAETYFLSRSGAKLDRHKRIKPSQCALHFVSKDQNGSTVERIHLTNEGQFRKIPEAFAHFFSDDFYEIEALMRAASIGRQK